MPANKVAMKGEKSKNEGLRSHDVRSAAWDGLVLWHLFFETPKNGKWAPLKHQQIQSHVNSFENVCSSMLCGKIKKAKETPCPCF